MTKVEQLSSKESNVPRVAVGVLIENPNGEIFLAKSHKWQGLWLVPGGHLEFGETLEGCVQREALEETGLNVDDIKFVAVLEEIKPTEFHDPNRHFIFINFACSLLDGEVKLNDEFQEFVWIKPTEALESLNLNSSSRKFIKKFLSNHSSTEK